MNQIVISGASGDLGRRVTQLLIDAGLQKNLTLITRTPAKLAEHAKQGIRICAGDYGNREQLVEAYQGGKILFLISGLNLGRRISEHRTAIDAAKEAGIEHIVYTSVGGVQPTNPALSAIDHYQSELDLRSSGMSYTILRNALYAEIVSNILVAPAAESGVMAQATGTGSLAPVAKADVARCAAVCLMNPAQHKDAVYEITGPELLDFEEIAALGSQIHGRSITYTPVSEEERLAFYDSVGMPRTYDPNMPPSPEGHMWASDELVSADVAISQGYQALLSHHVKQITGQDPELLREVMARVKSVRYVEIDA